MYCIYCVHEYHSCITFTDGTQFSKKIFREETKQNHDRLILVLEEQVAVGCIVFSLVHVLSKLNQYHQSLTELFNMILVFKNIYLYLLVVYPKVLYYIMTRPDTAKYRRFNPALRLYLHKSVYFLVLVNGISFVCLGYVL